MPRTVRPLSAIFVTIIMLTGCGGGGSSPNSGASSTGPAPAPPRPENRAPTISGTPATVAEIGEFYYFEPSWRDLDNDLLVFSISNQPSWATFDPTTGRLSGTPKAEHAGTVASIVISVKDAAASTALPSFSIEVPQTGAGSKALRWSAPVQNHDGSSLSDLAGFRIVYGKSTTKLDRVIVLKNPSLTRYLVQNLTAGTWYFQVISFNAAGTESEPSDLVSAVIS